MALLARMWARPVSAEHGGGLLGFRESLKLYAHHGAIKSAIGFLAWGGEGQAGRWLFQLTGAGCPFVSSWGDLVDLLEGLDARVTRLDLAVDFLDGSHTVDEAVRLWEEGGFTCKGAGQRPKSQCAGDWIGREGGRTFYVGRAENGKSLRAYEKGKQLGDPASEWVRFEVQFGNRDRVIPLRALVERDAFFAGAYPALQAVVEAAAEPIRTFKAQGEVTLAHQLAHLRRSYGKALHAASEVFAGENIAELVEAVRVIGLPRRLHPSSLAAGVEFADVLAGMKRVLQ